MNVHRQPNWQSGFAAMAIVSLTACASATPPQVTPVYQPRFDFSPPADLPPEDVDISVAIVEPEFLTPLPEELRTTAYEFGRALQGDLEEMLTERGFTVLGPFRSYDEMVYQDKFQTELMLTPRIDVLSELVDWEVSESSLLSIVSTGYRIDNATVSLGGRVTLEFAEPFTGEKLWVPSIELEKRERTFEGELSYEAPPQTVTRENNYRSTIHEMLEGVYAVIMKECWDRIVPAELGTYAAQSAQIREQSGHTRRPPFSR